MTQADTVLAELRRGPVDITDFPAGFRLAARIKDLRDRGHDISTGTRTLPGGTKVALYQLHERRAPAPMAGEQQGLAL